MGGAWFSFTHSPECSQRPLGASPQTECQTRRTDFMFRAEPQGSWLSGSSIPASLAFLSSARAQRGGGCNSSVLRRPQQLGNGASTLFSSRDQTKPLRLAHTFTLQTWLWGRLHHRDLLFPFLCLGRYLCDGKRLWFSSWAMGDHESCC